MASRILLPRTGLSILAGSATIISASLLLRPQPQLLRPYRCDASLNSPLSSNDWSYTRDAKTPVVTKDGKFNSNALRQISAGSICGVLGGVAISVFSKPLALIIGIMVFGLQFAESRGIHLVPTTRLQSYFKDINVRSAVQDNAAFKLSFGLTFALAAFAEF
ncbi:hypothetical protein K402DRAFT_398647 [Aulographum hederae CBS 113979]|uniref:FUN14-domain-containing protein n=1 Tax=Aulographum hederae CBS 113979 TaxID=1176131 RepID=A0A6G1GK43_9PEZI|nr:hypothetical protein K402DRAFT_398647 [Aulographum hederae CBS 113979]